MSSDFTTAVVSTTIGFQITDNISTHIPPTTPKPLICPVHYPLFMRSTYIYILPVMILFGLAGNSLTFAVFWRQRKECAHERTELLSYLAVMDSLYLITSIFSRVLPTLAKYHTQPLLFWSIWFRPVAYAIASSGQMMAAYTLVLVTAHRYALICHPLKVNQWMSTRRTNIAFAAMTAFCVAYNIPRLFELTVRVRVNSCLGNREFPTLVRTEFGSNLLYQVIYLNLLRFITRGVIPVVSQMLLTIAITRRLRSRTGPVNIRRRTMTLSHVLVVVAIVYLFCQIPAWVSSVLNSTKRLFKLKNKALNNFHAYFVIICNMLLSFNSSTNFVIYMLCGSAFKATLQELIPCCPERCRRARGSRRGRAYTVND